jgi:hypothetical protein
MRMKQSRLLVSDTHKHISILPFWDVKVSAGVARV